MAWDDRIGRRLKLKDLQTLMAVIETGGIGKAADRLNYSQPAVSKAIAGLERTVGKRLLDRGRKGIELTPYGDALLKCGAAIFDDLRKGIADIEFLADPTAGEVRVGCTEPVSAGLVSALTNRLSVKHPRISFHLELRHPSAICQELGERKLDLVITQLNENTGGDQFRIDPLYEDQVVIVAGRRHPIANKRRIKLADLACERWALPPPESFISSLLAVAFRAEGLGLPIRAVTTHSAYLRIVLVAGGQFLTVVPAAMLKASIERPSIKSLLVELPGNRETVAIVTLKDRPLSPVAQLFIEHARAVAKAMARD